MPEINAASPRAWPDLSTLLSREDIARTFGLRCQLESWRELSRSDRSLLYIVPSSPLLVVRVARRANASETDEEVDAVLALQRAGFSRVPRFLRAVAGTHRWAVECEGYGTASVYEFVPGETHQPLTDLQFTALLPVALSFFRACDSLPEDALPMREAFPAIARALERTSIVRGLVHFPSHLEGFIDTHDARAILSCCNYSRPRLLHGDLHGGNLVWSHTDELSGVIDFGSCGRGSQLLDISALMTGTCFDGYGLRLDRVSSLLGALAPLLRMEEIRPDAFVDLLVLTALNFFVEVNRLTTEPDVIGLEWRDAVRAAAIVEGRSQLTSIIVHAIQPDRS